MIDNDYDKDPDAVRQIYTRYVVRWVDQKLHACRMPFSSEATARRFADVRSRGDSQYGTTHVLKLTQTYEEELLTLREEETLND